MDDYGPQDPNLIDLPQVGEVPDAEPEMDLSNIDPAILARLADAGVIDREDARIALQLRRAAMLREQGQAGLQPGGMVGRTYVGASPFQHAAGAYQMAQGNQMEQGADQRMQDLIDRQRKAAYAGYQMFGAKPMPQGFGF